MPRTLHAKDWFHSDGFPLAVERREPQEPFDLHVHDFSELVVVTGGRGMHKIQERPMVVNGAVAIRPMMYLAVTYDHRIIDGREAVQFLVSIKDSLEDPGRMLLEI